MVFALLHNSHIKPFPKHNEHSSICSFKWLTIGSYTLHSSLAFV